jgi:lysophospholipase L1-like esterase
VLAAQERFYLHDKDSVVFYGDSITEQRLYTTFVETFVVTRYPQLNVRFVNSGWGRETVAGGDGGPVDLRLTRDVVFHKATVMTVMLGMNEGGGGGGGIPPPPTSSASPAIRPAWSISCRW